MGGGMTADSNYADGNGSDGHSEFRNVDGGAGAARALSIRNVNVSHAVRRTIIQ
jgi:hypothetical protein